MLVHVSTCLFVYLIVCLFCVIFFSFMFCQVKIVFLIKKIRSKLTRLNLVGSSANDPASPVNFVLDTFIILVMRLEF